jgi:hypothetical protein
LDSVFGIKGTTSESSIEIFTEFSQVLSFMFVSGVTLAKKFLSVHEKISYRTPATSDSIKEND